MQKIYTVIHASDRDQIFRNIARTILGGADGTFLINHAGIGITDMFEAFLEAKETYPEFFFGFNPLGLPATDAFRLAQEVKADGLWLDESYIRTDFAGDQQAMDKVLFELDKYKAKYTGQYFGSVAFKTQGPCSDPVGVAIKAMKHVDVVTTSGPGTAKAPDVAKIKAMKDAIGNFPLAIASGMTPDNIHLFPMADAILVASGIQDEWTELNTEKIKLMVERKAK